MITIVHKMTSTDLVETIGGLGHAMGEVRASANGAELRMGPNQSTSTVSNRLARLLVRSIAPFSSIH